MTDNHLTDQNNNNDGDDDDDDKKSLPDNTDENGSTDNREWTQQSVWVQFFLIEEFHLYLADDKLQDSAGGVSQGVKRRKKFRFFRGDSSYRVDKLHSMSIYFPFFR